MGSIQLCEYFRSQMSDEHAILSHRAHIQGNEQRFRAKVSTISGLLPESSTGIFLSCKLLSYSSNNSGQKCDLNCCSVVEAQARKVDKHSGKVPTSSSCSAWSKNGNSTLALSALMMHCIFLEGYQTGMLPRRAPGVRLGGDERM